MFSPSQLRLVAVLGLILSAQASAPIFVREDSASSSGTGVSVSQSSSPSTTPGSNASPSTTPSSSSSSAQASPSPTTTPSPSTTPTPTTAPSTSQSSSSSKNDDKSSTSTPPPSTSSSKSSSPITSQTSINTAQITPSVIVITEVQTESGGSVVSKLSSVTDSAGYSSALAAATSANAALASNNANKDSGSGMSTKTRNTIIGVVVGVGGAAIFAGLFIVAWRIWGRKRNQPDESDGLVGTGFGTGPGEKPVAGSPTSNPFQSTLETYHNPARGNVNASSNF